MEHILIIENDIEMGEMISEILSNVGFLTTIADNGSDGVKKALEVKPDLIICDIVMPNFDGYRVLDEIKQNKSIKYIPFLFLSGNSNNTDIRKGMISGADDYLTKPFHKDTLLETVKSCFKKKKLIKEAIQNERLNFKIEMESSLVKEKLSSIILNTTQEIIYIYHIESEQIVFFNNRMKKLIPEAEYIDSLQNIFELVHPDDVIILKELSSKATLLEDNRELHFEYRLKSPDGIYFYFSNRTSIFKRDNSGYPILCLSILQDITDHKEKMKIIENFYERISEDLNLANSTQAKLISFDFPKVKGFQFHIFYKSMEMVGGDFLATKLLSNGDLDIFSGDVSGHGISSSLVSAMAVVAFQMINAKDYLPNEILLKLHETLEKLVENHFISAAYLRLAANGKALTFARAGHPPLILIRDNKVIPLYGEGTFLIIFPDPIYNNYTTELQIGDKFLLFSDGLYEIFNTDEKMLGLESFFEWVQEVADKPIEVIIQNISERAIAYSNNKANDDMTLFGFQYIDNS